MSSRKRRASRLVGVLSWVLGALFGLSACSDDMAAVAEDDGGPARPELPEREWACTAESNDPDGLSELGCLDDFDVLAAAPLDASIPGARSVKTIIDRFDDSAIIFQNSVRYPTHYDYAAEHLSGDSLPIVPLLAEFNTTEYSSPTRRFLLGAVSWYDGPDVFVYEVAPYDSADAEMIIAAFEEIELATYFGSELRFYANSASIAATVSPHRNRLEVITTDELFAGIDYQPLNFAEAYGRVTFVTAEQLETDYVSFREIVVLDRVPNDISVVAGIITEEFQTTLSHINVLSRNRGTPNMALRGAFDSEQLRALDGDWVRLEVTPTAYTIEAATREEADDWWEANRPEAVQVPGLDDSVTGLIDIEDAVDLEDPSLADAIGAATRSVGGKAAHYSVLANIDGMPTPPGFAIPVYYYLQFMEQNDFDDRVNAMLDDTDFVDDPTVRDAELAQLRADIEAGVIDQELLDLVYAKLASDFPGIRMRFRSSTNAEDLDGFTGAGLYTSKSGDPNDPDKPIEDAIRAVWASVWNFRAFEERTYRSIDHLSVAMGILVHRSFPDEEANGVALTNNPFDPSGLEPAFYINVQVGEVSVVQPPAGVTTESLLYYFNRANQPVTYLSESSLVGANETVLSTAQLFELGTALQLLNATFAPAYANGQDWWAMDVEFKFDGEPGETPELFVKQARPYQ